MDEGNARANSEPASGRSRIPQRVNWLGVCPAAFDLTKYRENENPKIEATIYRETLEEETTRIAGTCA